jgi:hypothetical protein
MFSPFVAGVSLLSPSGILLPFGALSYVSVPEVPDSSLFIDSSRPARPLPSAPTKPTTDEPTAPSG